MNNRAQHKDAKRWIAPEAAETQPEEGYAEWLEAEVAAGCAELDKGKGMPAEKIWRDLGLE